ncbi:hypothetical protein [Candidatus Thioglobus sp.]|jgi:hypothetical protein|uniref:hypothetical protein n=1 Tax=Candidatus Thioglobus sp. TaxID=2026721 RepID=UPI001755CE89|nr:hypothetical protein [Candidatus Thioglobus sp.]
MKSRKELWLLLASFIVPIVLGSAFFYWNPGYFTQNTVNYGQFVDPIIITQEQDIVFSDATPGTLQGVWTLVYVTNQCDSECIQVIKDMETTRILMNEDMRRIQRMLVVKGGTNTQEPGLLIAQSSDLLSQKLAKFPKNTLFLIDPIGNIMLYYKAQNLEIKRVIKDLKRLFKYSRIG